MSRTEQFQGRNLEEVLSAAAARAGCRTEDLRFEVLQEDRGFLGVGTRSISVRVELPDVPPLPISPPVPRSPVARSRPSASDPGEAADAVPASSAPEDDGGAEPGRREVEAGSVGAEDDESRFFDEEPTGPDPTAPDVEVLVREIVACMGLDVQVTMNEEDARMVVELSGPDRDLALGEDGETLDALQYLVNRVAQRELGTVKRVQLESEGFRSEREEEIRQIALAAAEKVRRTGEPTRLPLLNPYERRIVHVTLSGPAGVDTESEGGGFLKRVVVRLHGTKGSAPVLRRSPRDEGRGEGRAGGGRGGRRGGDRSR